MPLLVPFPRTLTQEGNYSGRPTTTWGTTLTASATPHALGSKSVIVASTTYDARMVVIRFHGTSTSATVTDALANLYIGGAGVEQVLIANMLCGWAQIISSTGPGIGYAFPIRIPRGSRLTMDLRALIASEQVYAMVSLIGGDADWGLPVGVGVETLGADTSLSRGTQVTPGTTAEGAWTSIGTTTRRWRYVVGMQVGNADVTQNVSVMALDIGTGSALIPALENFTFTNTSGEIVVPDNMDPGRWCQIESGTALQARLQGHTSDTENHSVVLYGVY